MRGKVILGRSRLITFIAVSAMAAAVPSSANAEKLSSAELKERKRYCKVLEKQLKADVKINGSGNGGVVGLGGRFELDYPNDLSNQYLAAHTDHVMACGQWRRGKISSEEYRQVRERWISVYMAGTNEDAEEKNKAALESMLGSVARFGFTPERKADLDREFEAIRKEIRAGEVETGSRSEAVVKAINNADLRAATQNKEMSAQLTSLRERFDAWVLSETSSVQLPINCSKIFLVSFSSGAYEVSLTNAIIGQAASCGRKLKVSVTGYADTSGLVQSNTRLSAMRAASVAQALTQLGTPVSQITFGGSTKIFGTDPEKNRVVIITVEPT